MMQPASAPVCQGGREGRWEDGRGRSRLRRMMATMGLTILLILGVGLPAKVGGPSAAQAQFITLDVINLIQNTAQVFQSISQAVKLVNQAIAMKNRIGDIIQNVQAVRQAIINKDPAAILFHVAGGMEAGLGFAQDAQQLNQSFITAYPGVTQRDVFDNPKYKESMETLDEIRKVTLVTSENVEGIQDGYEEMQFIAERLKNAKSATELQGVLAQIEVRSYMESNLLRRQAQALTNLNAVDAAHRHNQELRDQKAAAGALARQVEAEHQVLDADAPLRPDYDPLNPWVTD